jgi:hypothetical protein
MDDIKKLFQTRDTAVAKKNYQQLAATQLHDIPNASVNGYIYAGQLKTDVLHVVEDTELKKVVFVKENYGTHSAFLLYFLVNTVDGWKIYNIVSSFR